MSSKLLRVRECEVVYRARAAPGLQSKHIASSADVWVLMIALGAPARATESLWAILLSNRQKVIGVHECARGGVASVPIAASDVFRAAIIVGSPAFVLAHNHPSGDCTPSAEDYAFTENVKEGAKVLGLSLLDHIVMGCDGFYSMLDAGDYKP